VTSEECRHLLEYDTWANERTCNACTMLTTEQFTRRVESSFPSVRDTLAHIMGTQWVWLERFRERPSPKGLPAPETFPDLAAVRERWTEIRADLSAYVNGLSESDVEHPFEYRNFKGDLFRDSPGPVLQHLVNHGTYHRGQVTTLLRQLGAKPVATDLIAFHRIRTGQ
jgi:uncharacterized damage-inducible protein DinB